VIRFRLAGIPVGVHLSFGFVALLAIGQLEGVELVAWTVAVFIAVLLHEAGHAFTARAFGASSVAITLFALGGVTTYPARTPMSPGRRFLVSAAGSGVGIAAGGSLLLLANAGAFRDLPDLVRVGISSFIFASLVWGILNWIPMLPLDGGQMLASALEGLVPKRAATLTRVISLVVGLAAMGAALYFEQFFAAFFVAFLLMAGLRQPMRPPPPDAPTDRPGGPAGAADQEPRPADPEPPAFPI
jgi:Zn-dependent protease